MRKLFAMMSAAVLAVSPVSAKTDEAHTRLIETLEGVGVTVLYNTKAHCMQPALGMYSSWERLLIICQQMSTDLNGRQVEWTAEDLDTLRHEAHHVLQDCVAGVLFDGDISNYYPNEESLRLVQRSLSREMIGMIMRNYTQMGASAKVLRNELEAFAVARVQSADTIAENITRTCRV